MERQPEDQLAMRMVDALADLSIEKALAICDPEVELTTMLDRPGEPGYRGHAGLREWFERLHTVWAFVQIGSWELEPQGDWVLVSGWARARGKASPNEVKVDFNCAATARGGLITQLGLFLTRAEALALIERGTRQ